jgi:hypothetical protein
MTSYAIGIGRQRPQGELGTKLYRDGTPRFCDFKQALSTLALIA